MGIFSLPNYSYFIFWPYSHILHVHLKEKTEQDTRKNLNINICIYAIYSCCNLGNFYVKQRFFFVHFHLDFESVCMFTFSCFSPKIAGKNLNKHYVMAKKSAIPTFYYTKLYSQYGWDLYRHTSIKIQYVFYGCQSTVKLLVVFGELKYALGS